MPTGNVDPGGRVISTITTPELSVAVGSVQEAGAPTELVANTVISPTLHTTSGDWVSTKNRREFRDQLCCCVPWFCAENVYLQDVIKTMLRGDNCMLLAHRPECTITLNSN